MVHGEASIRIVFQNGGSLPNYELLIQISKDVGWPGLMIFTSRLSDPNIFPAFEDSVS